MERNYFESRDEIEAFLSASMISKIRHKIDNVIIGYKHTESSATLWNFTSDSPSEYTNFYNFENWEPYMSPDYDNVQKLRLELHIRQHFTNLINQFHDVFEDGSIEIGFLLNNRKFKTKISCKKNKDKALEFVIDRIIDTSLLGHKIGINYEEIKQ